MTEKLAHGLIYSPYEMRCFLYENQKEKKLTHSREMKVRRGTVLNPAVEVFYDYAKDFFSLLSDVSRNDAGLVDARFSMHHSGGSAIVFNHERDLGIFDCYVIFIGNLPQIVMDIFRDSGDFSQYKMIKEQHGGHADNQGIPLCGLRVGIPFQLYAVERA